MLRLNNEGLGNSSEWTQAGIMLPKFDRKQMIEKTKKNPKWVHFGAGNLFRSNISGIQQELLDLNIEDTGIIVVETYDEEIIKKVYNPHDNLSLVITLHNDGNIEKKVVASVCESIIGDCSYKREWARLKQIFKNPSLQMISFTITEKGYNLYNSAKKYVSDVLKDFDNGPRNPQTVMAKIVSLLHERYLYGEYPIALVSMDNYSRNGDMLYSSVRKVAVKWFEKGFVDKGFIEYVNDPNFVSFPCSIINKITPDHSEEVKISLEKEYFRDTGILVTKKNTFIAPFVNTSQTQYLVIEDKFPNGRMKLEEAEVIFTDKKTLEELEHLKMSNGEIVRHTLEKHLDY